jgi:hypothetical protein
MSEKAVVDAFVGQVNEYASRMGWIALSHHDFSPVEFDGPGAFDVAPLPDAHFWFSFMADALSLLMTPDTRQLPANL